MGFRENKIFEYRISGEEKIIKIHVGQFYQWFNLSVKLLFLSIVFMKSVHGFDKGMVTMIRVWISI